MISNAKLHNNIIIYRRGVGYVMKLRALLLSATTKIRSKDLILYAIKEFTDIKMPRLWLFWNKKNADKLLNEILKYNVPPAKQASETIKNDNTYCLEIVDVLASEYGWTPEYIMETVNLYDFSEMIDIIQKRRINNKQWQATIQINPREAYKILEKQGGIDRVSFLDYTSEVLRDPAKREEIRKRIEARNGNG